MNLLSASNVTKVFVMPDGVEDVVAVDDVSLSARPGEFIAIVGPSGSGKSTLLYCLAGLLDSTLGDVVYGDVELSRLSRSKLARLRRDRVGFVFQSYNLVPYLNVRENTELTVRYSKKPFTRDHADAVLVSLGIDAIADRLPSEISGGQQQRVAIARILLSDPEIVFADEPTGALDSHTGSAIVDLLRARAHEGAAVLMVTHNIELATRADRVVVMRDGRVVAELTDHPSEAEILARMSGPNLDQTLES